MISRPYAALTAVAAGLALAVSFPRFSLWPAAIVGVALLTVAARGQRPRFAACLGFCCGLAFFAPTLHWTGIYVGAFPWLLLSVVEATYFAAMTAMMPRLQSMRGAPLWLAALWVLQEAVRGRWPFGGFGWARLAFSQADSPLRWLSMLAGQPFVSFTVALLGTLLAHVVVTVTASRAGLSATRLNHLRVLLPTTVALTAVIALVALTPLLARRWAPGTNDSALLAVIQGSTPDRGLDFAARRRQVLDNHVEQTMDLASDIHQHSVAQPQLVIWPENSSDIDPFLNSDAATEIQRAADAVRAPILVGAILDGPGDHVRNVGLMWFPHTGPGEMYVKRHPVPFAEYIPLRTIARHVSSKVDLVGLDMAAGGGNGLIVGGPFPFGDIICFEVTYDALVRSSVAAGAQLLVAQTNNATFGHTAETYQQLAMSQLRAVETQRTLIAASTTGVSAIIDADGQVIDRSGELFTPARLVRKVALNTRLTPAVRVGPLPEYLLATLAIVAFAVAKLRFTRRKHEGLGETTTRLTPRRAISARQVQTEGETVIR